MSEAPKESNTILVVDDESSIRTWLTFTLRRSGYATLEAASGEEALRILDGAAPRVRMLLTDLKMPGIDGAELGQRASRSYPHIHVLYMTGFATEAPAPKATVLYKPFTRAALLTEIERVFGGAGGPE